VQPGCLVAVYSAGVDTDAHAARQRTSGAVSPATAPTAAKLAAEQFEGAMSQSVSILLGGLICCVVPLAAFGAGVYYARCGFPLAIRWRGFGQADAGDEK
jgi:hypothetical protein